MVYIASDGTVHQGERPWDMKKIKDTFWAFVSSVELFVQTLIPFPILPGSSNRAVGNSRSSSNFRSSGSSGRSGGSSSRPSGGFRTISDIRPPPPTFGGCSGGSCGM